MSSEDLSVPESQGPVLLEGEGGKSKEGPFWLGVFLCSSVNPLYLWLEESSPSVTGSDKPVCRASGVPRVGMCHGVQAGAGRH